MTQVITEFETALRELYLSVTAPAPPHLENVAPLPPLRPTSRRSLLPNQWAPRGLAIAAAGAVVLAAALAATHQRSTAPTINAPAHLLSVRVLPAGAALNCSLPIVAFSADQTRGFIVLRNGNAVFQAASAPQGAYIAALHQWVDGTPRRLDYSDTTYYTVPETLNALTIAVHETRGSHTVYTGDPRRMSPMGWFGTDIVLFDSGRGGAGAPPREAHIQLLDPATGSVRSVPNGISLESTFGANGSSTGYIPGSGAMWTIFSRDDGTRTAIERYDLISGVTTDVYTDAGFIDMVGIDGQGHPIIQVGSRDIFHTDPARHTGIVTSTLIITSPQQATVLNHGRVGDTGVADNLSPLSVTDGDTVWMAADNGQIWQYTPERGMQLIARVTTSTQGTPGVAIAGPCR